MAKSKKMRQLLRPQLALVVGIGIGIVATGLLVAAQTQCAGAESRLAGRSGVGPSAEQLYLSAMPLGGHKLSARVRAVRALAKHPDSEPWLVLLFISSQTKPTGDDAERERQAALHCFELGIVAVAIDALPKHVDGPVLWSLTFLLREKERGRWSEEIGLVLTRKSSHVSRPIREIARACLKDRLGVDHEWDVSAWRTAITKRKANRASVKALDSEAGTGSVKTGDSQ